MKLDLYRWLHCIWNYYLDMVIRRGTGQVIRGVLCKAKYESGMPTSRITSKTKGTTIVRLILASSPTWP